MNTREILSHACQEHFREKALANMLVDMLEDDYFMTHLEALKDVARLRKAGRDAHYLVEATALLAKGSKLKRPIENLIRDAGSEEWRYNSTIIVIPGYAYPSPCTRRADKNHVPLFGGRVMTIGARRVLWIAEMIKSDSDLWDEYG